MRLAAVVLFGFLYDYGPESMHLFWRVTDTLLASMLPIAALYDLIDITGSGPGGKWFS